MRKWEYCYIDVTGEHTVVRFVDGNGIRDEALVKTPGHVLSYMAGLGADGWELAGVEVLPSLGATMGTRSATSSTVYWFKRPLP